MDNNIDIKVSVIIPIYNASNYLAPALDSVLDQTLTDIEIICIDDGSTDGSLEIIKAYQARDERVRIVTETNAGPAHARNNGTKRARGEYLAFLDADDFYEPTFLEELYVLAKKEDLDIAIAKYDIYNSRKARFEPASEADNAAIFDSGRITSKHEYPDHILSATVGSAWNKIFKRSFVADAALGFLTDVRMYEDVYFVVTAMSLAERVGKVQSVLMHHRIHSDQSRAKLFRRCYSQVPLVYLRIKEFLVSHGMYSPLKHSFLNLSVSRCYKIFNLLSGDSQKNFWNMLHDEYAELLDWNGTDASDFDFLDFCDFAVFVQLYNYDEYKKRLDKGGKLKVTNVKQNIQLAKNKKRLRRFFSRLFRKNH